MNLHNIKNVIHVQSFSDHSQSLQYS